MKKYILFCLLICIKSFDQKSYMHKITETNAFKDQKILQAKKL